MRVAVFVDIMNLMGAQRAMGWSVNMTKMQGFLSFGGEIVDATCYTSVSQYDKPGYTSFIKSLQYCGFAVKTKQATTNAATGMIVKGNLDIEMAVDIVTTMPIYDTAVLVTGDGDFEYLIGVLRSHGKQYKIVSTNSCMNWKFRESVGMHYVELSDHRELLERKYEGYEIVPPELNVDEEYPVG